MGQRRWDVYITNVGHDQSFAVRQLQGDVAKLNAKRTRREYVPMTVDGVRMEREVVVNEPVT